MLVTNVNSQNGQNIGRIKQQRVTLGERFGDSVALTEPLPAESRLVKQGGSFLNDGDLVRVVDGLNTANDKSGSQAGKTATAASTGTATQARS
jgi:hypothetical protein